MNDRERAEEEQGTEMEMGRRGHYKENRMGRAVAGMKWQIK